MNRKIAIFILLVLGLLSLILSTRIKHNYRATISPSSIDEREVRFSKEAQRIFASTIASGFDLNSGITIERSNPYIGQTENITFAVFNHTDESIVFPDQGFGLTIFRYSQNSKVWEKLQLQHMPYAESREIPAKIETWDLAQNSIWTIPQEDVMALGYKQIRVFVSGKGTVTNKAYGGYLDINISP